MNISKDLLIAVHTSLRTFRDVPKEKQDWTSYDDIVISEIEKLLEEA